MPRPKRMIQNTELDEAIKHAAWAQIQALGAGALTLRGISRRLGIAAPSIYHYYPNRDALVTALIVDAFHSLAESQRQAEPAAPANDYPARLAALGQAYRQWALGQPQRYLLVFGTPIPGYRAPEEITLPAAAAGFIPITTALQAAFMDGKLQLNRLPPLTGPLAAMLAAWQQSEGRAHAEVLYLALIFWSRIHGLMMFEINGQFPAFITDPGEVYAREIKQMNDQFFGMEYGE